MLVFRMADVIKIRADVTGLTLVREEFFPQGYMAKPKVHWVASWEYENSDGGWDKTNYGFDSMWIDEALEILTKAKEMLTGTS